MSHAQRILVLGLPLLALLSACSPSEPPAESANGAVTETPTTAALAQTFVDNMGGRAALEAADTLVLRGSGTRTRIGQLSITGGEDLTGSLVGVTETLDLANERAAFDYTIMLGEFGLTRTEVLTTFEGKPVGWATGPNRPNIATSVNGIFSWGTQNSPEMALKRNVITVALAAATTASANQNAEQRAFNGGMSLYGTAQLPSGENIELYFNPATGMLDGYATLDTETMLGDVDAEYVLADYRPVGDLVLPHSVTIRKDNRAYASIQYDSIAVNDPAALEIFTIPASALEQAREVVATEGGFSPLTLNRVARNVYHAVGYSHHSMVVEFPTFVAVVEGPYTEAQSETLVRLIDEEIGKPIRYVAPSHPHYDHTGGIRGLAAVGATVLVAQGHEAELRGIVESPHTNPPDGLARAASGGGEVGAVEVFTGMTVVEEGDQRLELHEVTTIPHVNPYVIAYVPSAEVIFQSDLNLGMPGPDASAVYAIIRDHGFEVDEIVGGHGGVQPFAELEAAATSAPPAQ